MLNLSFFVPGVPIAQPRPRVVTVHGRAQAVSNPAKHPVTAWKQQVKLAARQAVAAGGYGKAAPTAEPVSVTLLFVMPRPKSLCWKTKATPRQWHTSKPDGENLSKALADCLTGIIFVDDAQVCDLHIRKVIAAGDEKPGVLVTVVEVLELAVLEELGVGR